MNSPSPKNPKGAGRKPSPDKNKIMESFWCEPALSEKLKDCKAIGFKSKADLINYALRNFFSVYENPNDED